VLGDGDRGHAERHRLIEHLVDAARSVEQRVLGVKVKVDELVHDLVLASPPAAPDLVPGLQVLLASRA
jgi:hypothetical protein